MLIFSTGNDRKFAQASAVCKPYGLRLRQSRLDVDEIQGEDAELIVAAKARRAYELVQAPVIVSDDSWDIPGLRGFPGPYMKSLNYWFCPEDFINLTQDLTDRRIFLHAYLAYCDGHEPQVFVQTLEGWLGREVRGTGGPPMTQVVGMAIDNGLTIAEVHNSGRENDPARLAAGNPWHDFATWYTAH